MKYILVLLGVVGLMTPLTSSAAPAGSATSGGTRRWLMRTEVVGHGANQIIYYYTNVVLVGSHLPAVLRRYHGRIEIVGGLPTNSVSYGFGDLDRAGTNDVGSALSRLDPAISVR